jgi:biopolymer transport protein ExbD
MSEQYQKVGLAVAFKRRQKKKERVELVSLMDMIFILLVFFLVTNFVIQTPPKERSLYIPVPKNQVGRAQMLIQFIDNNHVFWLDERSSDIVEEVESNYGYLSDQRLRDIILERLFTENTLTMEELASRLDAVLIEANEDPTASSFILIRCPHSVPYFVVINIIARLSETQYSNVKYGCVSGTIEEIRNCRKIYTAYERDARGNQRKNIRIDFVEK